MGCRWLRYRWEGLSEEVHMVVEAKTSVVECLQRAQANALVLYLNAKRAHWFTYGPLFRDVHLFWDEVANAAIGEVDPLGERLRMLGADPVSTPDELAFYSSIRVLGGKPTVREMLEQALENERQIIDEMRDAAYVAEEARDPGSNDLLSGLVQTHEKHAWFIDEFLRRGDGLVS
jgi:starvation-inducible DNA-binding protein